MFLFPFLNQHADLGLRRQVLQRAQRQNEIRHIRARVIVASAVNEFPHKKIGCLQLYRAVQIAGRVETTGLNAELVVQSAEIGMEWGFDQ